MAKTRDTQGNTKSSAPDNVSKDETPNSPTSTTKKTTGSNFEEVLGKRLSNPLAKYSSYTYQLSLYMISPDAYDAFVRNGRRKIELFNDPNSGGGAYVIAQSGGINNGTSLRAPGFHYDYGIDDLEIKSVISPNGTSMPTTNYSFNFTITEQYGFSFITNLKRAKDAMDQYSSTTNVKDSTNTSRQFFVLGIRFLGYDASGNVINQNSEADTFERYYDIFFVKINFKIDGKMTVYHIEGVSIAPHVALGQKRGVIDKGAHQLTGTTVQNLCDALIKKLNDDQRKEVPNVREFANTYEIKFIDDAAIIASSKIVTSADLNKLNWPMAVASQKTNINPSLEIKAQPNNNQRVMAFNRDTPIIQAIQQIINQSTYLINGLQAVYNTNPQPNLYNNKVPIDSNMRAKWFNISTVVSEAKFDRKIKDYAYKITYQIRTYETPVSMSTAVDRISEYYGPFKIYNYWFTGKNSEVIRYEQTMNNNYFVVALDPNTTTTYNGNANGGNAQIPVVLNKRTPAPRLGKLNLGLEAQNNYVTSLIDPSAYATSSMTILGDPDLLANEMATGSAELDYNSVPFYGPDGFSIDPRRGQVFIEVDFKEAVDYEHNSGVMRINDKILFWDYPKKIVEKTQGRIVFMITQIKSVFRGGKFTQDLSLVIAPFGGTGTGEQQEEEQRQEQQRENALELNRLAQKAKPPVGLVKDKPPGGSANGKAKGATDKTSKPTKQQTNKKGVADDDSFTAFPY